MTSPIETQAIVVGGGLAGLTDEVFQTEIVLRAWRLGICIEEVPVSICEMRSAPVSILRRVPKVLGMVRVLKRSLGRFPLGVSEVHRASVEDLRLEPRVETPAGKSTAW